MDLFEYGVDRNGFGELIARFLRDGGFLFVGKKFISLLRSVDHRTVVGEVVITIVYKSFDLRYRVCDVESIGVF